MNIKINNILRKIIYYTGLNSLSGNFLNSHLFIFGFHSIQPDNVSNPAEGFEHLTTSANAFRRRLMWLKDQGHTFITFDMLENPEIKNLHKPTIIYFDDGFRDTLTVAEPILRGFGIPGTVFIASGLIDRTHMLWAPIHRRILSQKGYSEQQIESEITRIKSLSEDARLKSMRANTFSDVSDLFLTWDELRELRDRGFSVGAHVHSHLRLPELSGEKLLEELALPQERIQKELRLRPKSLSFPHGRWNTEVLSKARSMGYKYAVSIGHGANPIKFGDFNVLKNIPDPKNSSLVTFATNCYIRSLLKRS